MKEMVLMQVGQGYFLLALKVEHAKVILWKIIKNAQKWQKRKAWYILP